MPNALLDLVSAAALLVMLAVAFLHPPAWVEALVGVLTATIVVVSGLAPGARVVEEVGHLLPVVGFLMAILVVAEVCAVEGVFAWVGGLLSRVGGRRPVRLLALTFVAAALTTAVLSLDATVVLLTPVVAATAAGARVGPRPMVYACVRLANSASLLLPVSNLTNLLAMPSLGISLVPFAVTMAPVWCAVLATEYVGHRLFFNNDLAPVPPVVEQVDEVPVPRFALLVVTTMLLGFAVTSPLDVAPAWVAAGAALALTVHAVRAGRLTARDAMHALHPAFAVYVLCLGVVVVGVSDTFLGDLVSSVLPSTESLGGLVVVTATATLVANLVNNLPATLLLLPLVAPLGTVAVLAALIGLNVGSNLTYAGSLANLLWRRTLTRGGMPPSTATFHRLSALVTLPSALVAVVVLWLWAPGAG